MSTRRSNKAKKFYDQYHEWVKENPRILDEVMHAYACREHPWAGFWTDAEGIRRCMICWAPVKRIALRRNAGGQRSGKNAKSE